MRVVPSNIAHTFCCTAQHSVGCRGPVTAIVYDTAAQTALTVRCRLLQEDQRSGTRVPEQGFSPHHRLNLVDQPLSCLRPAHAEAAREVWQGLQAQAALPDQMGQPRRHHAHSPRQHPGNQELGV